MKNKTVLLISALLISLFTTSIAISASKPTEGAPEPEAQTVSTKALKWRFIGPGMVSAVRKDKTWKASDDDLINLSRDEGKSWKKVSMPEGETIRVIREDTVRPGLLYSGTQTGIFVSLDDGETWTSISENLPAVPVLDIEIKDADLIIATDGRGSWILNDINPIRDSKAAVYQLTAHLYPVYDYTRAAHNSQTDYPTGGDPKTAGVVIYFHLNKTATDVSIQILDEKGKVIQTYDQDDMSLNYYDETDSSFNSGLNRFVWDMRYPGVTAIPEQPVTAMRPLARPGKYFAKLIVGKHAQLESFGLHLNPDESYTREQTDAKFVFWMDLYESMERSTQDVLKALRRKKDALKKVEELKADGIDAEKLIAVEQQATVIADLVDTFVSNFLPVDRAPVEHTGQAATVFTRMTRLHTLMEASEGPPTEPMVEALEEIKQQGDAASVAYKRPIMNATFKFQSLTK